MRKEDAGGRLVVSRTFVMALPSVLWITAVFTLLLGFFSFPTQGVVVSTEYLYLNVTVTGQGDPATFFDTLSQVLLIPSSQFLYESSVSSTVGDEAATLFSVWIVDITNAQKGEVYYFRQNPSALEYATGYSVEDVSYAILSQPTQAEKLLSINFNFNDMVVLYSE